MDGLPADSDTRGEVLDALRVLLEIYCEFHMTEHGAVLAPRQAENVANMVRRQMSPLWLHRDMNWLDHYMTERDISGNALAAQVGTTRQTISKLRSGKMKLTREYSVKLAAALKIEPENLLFGPTAEAKLSVQTISVRGEAAPGRWVESGELGQGRFPPVSAVLGEYPAEEQFAYRIVGSSMEQIRIFDGDFVICVPYWNARLKARSGDIVIIEQRQGDLTERSCKQIIVTQEGYELWPRSEHPRWHDPIVIPKADELITAEGNAVEIVGLVIGLYVPMNGSGLI